MKKPLIEQFSAPLIIVEEIDSTKGGRFFMKGKLQQTSVNQNNRVYSKPLWEQLFSSEDYNTKLKRGTLIGGIGHPKDGIFDPEKGCLVTREMELVNDEDVDGILEIITKHPHGMILEIYYKSGVFYPVSSRGRGDSESLNDGTIDVTPGTYEYEGHDAVIDPSVKDATPDYVYEALKNNKNFIKYADLVREKLQDDKIDVNFIKDIKRLVPLTFQFHESSNNYKNLNTLIESRETEVTGEGKAKTSVTIESPLQINNDDPEIVKKIKDSFNTFHKDFLIPFKQQTESIQDNPVDINEKEKQKNSMSEQVKTIQQLTEELAAEKNKNSLSESSSKLASTTQMLESAKKLLEADVKKISNLNTLLGEEKKRFELINTRHNVLKKIAEASIAKSKSLHVENKDLKSDLDASKKVIEELCKQLERTKKVGISKVISDQVARFPEALKVKAQKALSECKTVESVEEMSESMLNLIANFADHTLPPPVLNGEKKVNGEEKKIPIKQEEVTLSSIVGSRYQEKTPVKK